MRTDCILCYIVITILILHTIYVFFSKNAKEIIIKNQRPWKKIIQHNGYNQYFLILDVLSYNNIQSWQRIIPGLEIKNNELTLPAVNEADALAIANLIISNCNNLISFNDIMNKDLIDISIQKARNYELVRNKLRDQISNHSSSDRSIERNMNKSIETYQEEKSNNQEESLSVIELEPMAYNNSSNDLFGNI
jgi:hypothetical protein